MIMGYKMAVNYIIEDISGKVELYDKSLFNAIAKELKLGGARLLLPGEGLLSLVPRKYKSSESLIKRATKVIEGLLNYCLILLFIKIKGVQVLHLQWLPFMEINGWELPILRVIRKVSPKTKIVLTIHNVYPHNMSDSAKKSYNIRFRKACALIDEFIVHTEISKLDVIKEFGIDSTRVNVCCHGVFVPEGVTPKVTNREDGKLHILQFGGQSYYKGTDVLVDAVCGLEKSLQDKIETHIVGGISRKFLDELKQRDKDGIVTWKPYFLDDKELHEEINNSDLIVLPYRAISQSGVLLLSIYFGKLIICSDLPSFKETMQGGEGEGLDNDLFFENENSTSLRSLIERYINNDVDEGKVHERITHLKDLYSWETAAKATIRVYNRS